MHSQSASAMTTCRGGKVSTTMESAGSTSRTRSLASREWRSHSSSHQGRKGEVERSSHSRRRRIVRSNVILRSDKDPMPRGIDEVKLWVDANLASKLGGGVVNTKSGPGGSGWARTYVLELKKGGKLFAKLASGRDKQMFQGEFEGLNAMAGTNTIGVPRAFHYDDLYGSMSGSWILMEHIDMSGRLDQREFGSLLGQMHLHEPLHEKAKDEGMFGFQVENTIGATPQPNEWMSDWCSFFRERRLWHQLQLAGDTKLLKLGEVALQRMDEVFHPINQEAKPCILHGDLWSGNVTADKKGKPVIFDPACYYGHPEAEFGMSWCASFGDQFWGAYHDVIPKEPGFSERLQLYMLYHYLNHLNLFGSSYYYSCENILRRFN